MAGYNSMPQGVTDEFHRPFVGTWKLNPDRSEFDPNHRPSQATMTLELEAVKNAESGRDQEVGTPAERYARRTSGLKHTKMTGPRSIP